MMIPPPHFWQPPLGELPEDLDPIDPRYLAALNELPPEGLDVPIGFPDIPTHRRVSVRWKILFDLIGWGVEPNTELITEVATKRIAPGTNLNEAIKLFYPPKR